jgi:PadR family transcriptional regulator, regulatory protein PadR
MRTASRADLLQGTLDMLILRTLAPGRAHGHEIAKHIKRTSDDLLQIEHGSLYPALHRLERRGLVTSTWDTAPTGNRQFRYYRLTLAGRRRLRTEHSRWEQLANAISRIMRPA